jgi:hypothetical protein
VVQSIEGEICFFLGGLSLWAADVVVRFLRKAQKRVKTNWLQFFYKNLAREFGAPLPSV